MCVGVCLHVCVKDLQKFVSQFKRSVIHFVKSSEQFTSTWTIDDNLY